MKEEKSFWEKLKRWIDGDEVLLDADEIISKKEKKEFIYEERIFPIGDIRSNVTLYCVLSVFVTVVFIAVMLHVVMELPMFGDPNSITNNEVAARYLEKGIAETGAINFVAGMILDYRAFDTFGESNVLFMAVIAVLMLLQYCVSTGHKSMQIKRTLMRQRIRKCRRTKCWMQRIPS